MGVVEVRILAGRSELPLLHDARPAPEGWRWVVVNESDVLASLAASPLLAAANLRVLVARPVVDKLLLPHSRGKVKVLMDILLPFPGLWGLLDRRQRRLFVI